MRTKTLRIKSRVDFNVELLRAARKIDRGEKVKGHRVEYFESLGAVRNVLTPRRLELWHLIRDRKPASISNLAILAERNFKSVYQDVRLLVAVGIVDLRETRGKGGKRLVPIPTTTRLTMAPIVFPLPSNVCENSSAPITPS
jgi:predicted transcriptional regulator